MVRSRKFSLTLLTLPGLYQLVVHPLLPPLPGGLHRFDVGVISGPPSFLDGTSTPSGPHTVLQPHSCRVTNVWFSLTNLAGLTSSVEESRVTSL